MRFLSIVEIPCASEEVIMGIVISTETKTGTWEVENQKSANKIKDTTGVAFIIESGNCNKSEMFLLKPIAIPKTIEIQSE